MRACQAQAGMTQVSLRDVGLMRKGDGWMLRLTAGRSRGYINGQGRVPEIRPFEMG